MKRLLTSAVLILSLISVATPAFPWGSATHAHIDGQLGKRVLFDKQERYGGMGMDVFNFLFTNPAVSAYLYGQTHTQFMKVWDAARLPAGKALAFGFVSHNDVWGADVTAHHNGLTFGQGQGYVIAKAEILKGILEQNPEFAALNLPDPVVREIAHNFIEYGTDILLKRIDPHIGEKIIISALVRSPEFPLLLVKAYGEGLASTAGMSRLEASRLIIATEMEFRKTMIAYGQALTRDEATALQLFAEQLAALSTAFLAAYGIVLPDGVDLVPLAKGGIEGAMLLCAPDFSGELAATVEEVKLQLTAHGIRY
ncbi:hypothetical protein [Geobacter sp.]|uniref:hypothetical protein n=1 Tax=Geobacter sp. TaxID=46610 RepID=UPI0027B8FB24|nr:hypothetical protein [Geobacter sp.]